MKPTIKNWSLLCLAIILASSIIVPVMLTVLHLPWYVDMYRGRGAFGMRWDNIDTFQISFALTWIICWLLGTVVIGGVSLIERRLDREDR